LKYTEINPEKLKLNGDRILIRTRKPEQADGFEERASGILVAKGSEIEEKDPGNIAEVVKVGEGVTNPNLSHFNNMDVLSKETHVIHTLYAGFKFSHGDYDYTIISENEVLAVV
jgi:co-chaperonin GroES (HSP10)